MQGGMDRREPGVASQTPAGLERRFAQKKGTICTISKLVQIKPPG
jgi:hypothetical protein